MSSNKIVMQSERLFYYAKWKVILNTLHFPKHVCKKKKVFIAERWKSLTVTEFLKNLTEKQLMHNNDRNNSESKLYTCTCIGTGKNRLFLHQFLLQILCTYNICLPSAHLYDTCNSMQKVFFFLKTWLMKYLIFNFHN